jgi:hypothetical protein
LSREWPSCVYAALGSPSIAKTELPKAINHRTQVLFGLVLPRIFDSGQKLRNDVFQRFAILGQTDAGEILSKDAWLAISVAARILAKEPFRLG